MEIYIDDTFLKTKEDDSLFSDLGVVFGYLRQHNMRLNPQKAKRFLGFMLIYRGLRQT